MARKISGIYIPIQLETSAIDRDFKLLREEMGKAAADMTRAFDGALNTRKFVTGFSDVTRSVGQLRDAALALQKLKPFAEFDKAIEQLRPELSKLASTLGITAEQQDELLRRMAQNTTITQQVDALKKLERALGTTKDETVALARAYGLFVSEMASDRYLQKNLEQTKQLQPIISQTATAYQKLARAAGEIPSAKNFKEFLDTKNIREAVSAFKQLHPNLKLTAEHYKQIADAAGVAERAVRQYIKAQSGGGRGILGAFSPSNMTAGIQSAMGAMGVVGGMYGVVELGKSMVNASLKMDNIKIAFESIYGSAEKAGKELEFVREISDRLGLSFTESADGAKKLFASAQGTILEKDARKIFTAFSNMGAALKLSGDEMNGVFLAISQSLAKNRVMAEELKGQLAERMPGAVALFAKSIGVSTQELDNMLQKGAVGLEHLAMFVDAVQEKYKAGAAGAASGLQAELNRVSNAWFDLKRAFVDSDALADAVRSVGKGLRFLADNADGIGTVISQSVKFIALTAGFYGVSKAVIAVGTAFSALGAGGVLTTAISGVQKFFAVFSRINPLLAASTAMAGIALAIYENETAMSAGEKALEKYSAGFDDLAKSAEKAKKSIEEMTDKEKAVELDRLRVAADKAGQGLRDLFNIPLSLELPTNVVDSEMEEMLDILNSQAKSGIETMFENMRLAFSGDALQDLLAQARSVTEKFGQDMQDGLARGFKADELKKILNDAQVSLQDLQNKMQKTGASDAAIKQFEKLKYIIGQVGEDCIKSSEEVEKFGKAVEKVADLSAEATTAFDAIHKLTQGSEYSKMEKLGADIQSLSDNLVTLKRSADEASVQMDKLGAEADTNSEEWKKLQTQITQFNSSIPLVASAAIAAGVDFAAFSNQLEAAAQKAGMTEDAIQSLKAAMQGGFNIGFADSIHRAITEMEAQMTTFGKSREVQTAYSQLSKFVTSEANKVSFANAVMAKDSQKAIDIFVSEGKALADATQLVNTAFTYAQKSMAASGGGRRRSGGTSQIKQQTQELSAMAKEILEVEKKIGSLQARIDDDPSVKYWADVNGELTKIQTVIDKTGAGTETERQRLIALRDEYAALARDRAAQMAEEEKHRRIIEAASKMSQGYGKLGSVSNNVPAKLMIASLREQYKENLKDYQKLVADKLISEEDFVSTVEQMNEELNIKVGLANDSMLARFAEGFIEQQEALKDWQDSAVDTVIDGFSTMSDALGTFFVTGMNNTKELGEAFSDMVSSMIQDLAKLFAKMVIMSSLNAMFGSFFGGGSSGQVVGWTTAGAGGGFTGPITMAAKGGFFGGGNISSYSGKVVSQPTFFSGEPIRAFASGGNIMGEKGPEVVLPVVKGAGGRYGVEARAATPSLEMNQNVSVNVYNNSDSKVTTSQSRDSNGNLDIKVMVEKIVGESLSRAGSAPFRTLRNVWNGTPALVSR